MFPVDAMTAGLPRAGEAGITPVRRRGGTRQGMITLHGAAASRASRSLLALEELGRQMGADPSSWSFEVPRIYSFEN